MKKIIITGGLGFIGTHLCNKLLKDEFEIIIFDNYLTNVSDNIENCKIINIDLTSKKIDIDNNIFKNVDSIVHLAAQASGPFSFVDPIHDANLNIICTLNVIELCKKYSIKNLYSASTFAVYGDPINPEKPIMEDDLCSPKSLYGVSKLASEQYIRILCAKYDIRWNILRMFNVYGPGQDLTRLDQGVVSIFLNYIRSQNVLPVKGSLDRFRDLVYIDDVIQAWSKCIMQQNASNKVYNVASGKKHSFRKLIEELIDIYGKKNEIKIHHEDETPGDILGCYANISRISNDLNYLPKFSLRDGLTNFKDWANNQPQ